VGLYWSLPASVFMVHWWVTSFITKKRQTTETSLTISNWTVTFTVTIHNVYVLIQNDTPQILRMGPKCWNTNITHNLLGNKLVCFSDLLNEAANSWASVVGDLMSMEQRWNDNDRGTWSTGRKTLYSVGGRWMDEYGAMVEWYWQGKLKYWEKNFIQRRW
jgi:hypothetical protein